MRIENDLTDNDLGYWQQRCPDALRTVMRRPPTMDNCADCATIATHTDDGLAFRMAWRPDEIDVAHLGRGSTLWLSAWFSLPIFTVEAVHQGEASQLELAHITGRRLAYWQSDPTIARIQPLTIGGPPEEPDCEPVPAIATVSGEGDGIFRVGLTAGDVATTMLAQGGLLWLSMWGRVAPHSLEVQPAA
ncbi:MAG: hypothetical protein Q8K63_13785 [Acidimicrobiales bacterium]|nr:hypothetical protein [Acidimicrobiales bacterium]